VPACLPKSEWRVQFGRRMASSAAGQRGYIKSFSPDIIVKADS